MGRGALSKVRWKNDRIRKKKERDKRRAEAGGKSAAVANAQAAAVESATQQTGAVSGGGPATESGS